MYVYLYDYKVPLGAIGIEINSSIEWFGPTGWEYCGIYQRFPAAEDNIVLKLEGVDTTPYEIYNLDKPRR